MPEILSIDSLEILFSMLRNSLGSPNFDSTGTERKMIFKLNNVLDNLIIVMSIKDSMADWSSPLLLTDVS